MKYVFWGPEFQPAYVMFTELFERADTVFLKFKLPSYILVKIYWSLRPFRLFLLFYLTVFKNLGCRKDDKAVFIYYNPWGEFLAKSGCLERLKKKYRNAIHVVLLYDAVVARKLDIGLLKANYDKVFIYDKNEADRYKISFFPPCYSRNFDVPAEDKVIFDVSFVGQARDRLKEIRHVCNYLTSHGITCRFYIVDVDKEEREPCIGIVYGDRYLTQEEYFRNYIAPASVLLEIANHGTDAITARVREAVMYDKKILTNNSEIKKYKYYNPKMIQIYKDVTEIDSDFFRSERESYNYAGDFSPTLLLEELQRVYNEIHISKYEKQENFDKSK